ncbi:transcription factor bHLH30-like [Miscanthus floridulus]|uniref:transcription factor bHLH30-like n=1 Tax=Miscanthus floridulus TaxID=154761 RepID=UPI0034598E4D
MAVTDDGEGERSTPAPAPALRKKERGRSHSEAERKRRQRINVHLATLRTLVPSASRMDKAALLGEVVRHVRELRAKASDAAAGVGPGVIPGEGDEVGAEEEEDDFWRRHGRHFGADAEDSLPPRRVVRAWVCCDDRPGLLSDLGRAVRSVRNARPVRVEIATVGGRTRSVLELDVRGDDDDGNATAATGNGRAVALSTLRAAMRAVLLNRDDHVVAAAGEGYKRPRFSSAQIAKEQ